MSMVAEVCGIANPPALAVDGQRRVGRDEALLAHLVPKLGGDDGLERSMILGDALRATGARDHGSRGRMGERELQRCSFDGHLVALGNRLDALDLGDDLRRRLLILEVSAASKNT